MGARHVPADAGSGDRPPRATVFAPTPLLTVTVEARPDGVDDIHVHAGGQGVWIARMLATLGADTVLCGAFAGETGDVVAGLVEREGVRVSRAPSTAGNGGYVHDRREGDRAVVATTPPSWLPRHELDQLYNMALVEGLDADVAVLAGPDGGHVLSADVYRRLAADLSSGGVAVVADLSGEYLTAAADGGARVVKASHEDLVRDGLARSDDPDRLAEAMRDLAGRRAEVVVVSRAAGPALVLAGDRFLEVRMPTFDSLDHHGAGDSMTAGIAAGLARGHDLEAALRLGAAAGALNSTRHGLATGEPDLIDRLTGRIEIRPAEGLGPR